MIKLAIIGTGEMANAHASEFQKIPECTITACSDIVPGRAKEFADKYGIPSAYENNERLFANEDLDAVSVVTPDMYHMQPVMMALEKNLHVMCEKPLASNSNDAHKMADTARKKGVITAVNFSYRNSPATQMAAEIAASGELGRIIHVEGSYLQCWLASKCWGDWKENPALLWRLSTKHGSLGTLGDIGVHLLDLTSFVVGEFKSIDCKLKTFNKGIDSIGEYVFDANDSLIANVEFNNGALGVLHSSRWTVGRENTITLRVYGDKGSIDLILDRPEPDTLRICKGDNVDIPSWEQVVCPPVPNMYQRFITAILEGKQGQTSFDTGARIQSYIAGAIESDAANEPVVFGNNSI